MIGPRLRALASIPVAMAIAGAAPAASFPIPADDPPAEVFGPPTPYRFTREARRDQPTPYPFQVSEPANLSWLEDDGVKRYLAYKTLNNGDLVEALAPTDLKRRIDRDWERFEHARRLAYDPDFHKGASREFREALDPLFELSGTALSVIPIGATPKAGFKIFDLLSETASRELDRGEKFVYSQMARAQLDKLRLEARARLPLEAAEFDFNVAQQRRGNPNGKLVQLDGLVAFPLVGIPAGTAGESGFDALAASAIESLPPSRRPRLEALLEKARAANANPNANPNPNPPPALRAEIRADVLDCAAELTREATAEARALVDRAGAPDQPANLDRDRETKQALDALAKTARALGVVARLIDPEAGRDVGAVAEFIAESAAEVGVYVGLASASVPGLVAGLALATARLVANLVGGTPDPSLALLRRVHRDVLDGFRGIDRSIGELRLELFAQFDRVATLVTRQGDERRAEARLILAGIAGLDAKLDTRFGELVRFLETERETRLVQLVADAIDPVARDGVSDEAVKRAVEVVRSLPPAIDSAPRDLAAVPDLAALNPGLHPWRNIPVWRATTLSAAGLAGAATLPPLGGVSDLRDHLLRVDGYVRLMELAPRARELIRPEITRDLLRRTLEARRALTDLADPADVGVTLVHPPGRPDPVVGGLLDRRASRLSALRIALREERRRFAAAELAGLDPWGSPAARPLVADATPDTELVPPAIRPTPEVERRYRESAPKDGEAPALPLLPGDRARVAERIHPVVRNAIRIGELRPDLEWTAYTRGAAPYEVFPAVNAGDMVVTRHRRSFNAGQGVSYTLNVDNLYFHGRFTLNIRLTLKPADPATLARNPDPLPLFDRIVVSNTDGQLLGWAFYPNVVQSRALEAPFRTEPLPPRLSTDLDVVRLMSNGQLRDYQRPPDECSLPGPPCELTYISTHLPPLLRANPNPFAVRFAQSPDRDLLSNEALVIRDDGYTAQPDEAARRLFPREPDDERRAALLAELVRARRGPDELAKLRGTALYRDANGAPLPRRDVGLAALIQSRTDSDLAGYWTARRAEEERVRERIADIARDRVQRALDEASKRFDSGIRARFENPADPIGRLVREINALHLLLDAHLRMRYPLSTLRDSAFEPLLRDLSAEIDFEALRNAETFAGPPPPDSDPAQRLLAAVVDRPAEPHPELDAAVVRLRRVQLLHEAVAAPVPAPEPAP